MAIVIGKYPRTLYLGCQYLVEMERYEQLFIVVNFCWRLIREIFPNLKLVGFRVIFSHEVAPRMPFEIKSLHSEM